MHKNKKPAQGCASCDKHKGAGCPSNLNGDDSDPIEDDMEEDGMREGTDEHTDEDADSIVDYSIADDGHVLDDEIIDFKE